MQSLQNTVNMIIGFGTLLSHIFLIIVLVLISIEKGFRAKLYRFVHSHILNIIFIEGLFALVGSLAYSQFIGFPPCELCWIQRIFIYPQVLISFIAIMKKDKNIVDYLLPMSVIGGVVAFYQSLIQWGFTGVSVLGCTAAGTGECAKIFVNAFGYITIPLMSFTIFVYSVGVILIYYQARKIHG